MRILIPDIWYDRKLRMWCLLWKDLDGTQHGGAEYYPTKKMALDATR